MTTEDIVALLQTNKCKRALVKAIERVVGDSDHERVVLWTEATVNCVEPDDIGLKVISTYAFRPVFRAVVRIVAGRILARQFVRDLAMEVVNFIATKKIPKTRTPLEKAACN